MSHIGAFWTYNKEAVAAVEAAGLEIVAGKSLTTIRGHIYAQVDFPTSPPLYANQLGNGDIFYGQHNEVNKFGIDKDGNISPVGTVDGVDISAHAVDVAAHHAKYTDANVYAALALRPKVIAIGDWDMDTVLSVNIAHGLTKADIRVVDILINGDNGYGPYPIFYHSGVDMSAGGDFSITATDIVISRVDAGPFDNVGFNETPFNRGWIVIWYVP